MPNQDTGQRRRDDDQTRLALVIQSIANLEGAMAEFKNETRQGFQEIRAQITNLNHVHVDVYAADRMAQSERDRGLEKRVSVLENRNEWLVRLVGAVIIVAVLAAIGLGAGGHLP